MAETILKHFTNDCTLHSSVQAIRPLQWNFVHARIHNLFFSCARLSIVSLVTHTPIWNLSIERQWVERAQQGEQLAFRMLLERYGSLLYRYVLLPRLGNEAWAKDALSETYERIVTSITRYEWRASGIYPWFRTLAFNIAIDHLRARKREVFIDYDELVLKSETLFSSEETPIDLGYFEQEEKQHLQTRIEFALSQLNLRYAQAIRLRILQELSREQVAEMLNVSPATFDVILHRALTALRKIWLADPQDSQPQLPTIATK